MPNASEKVRIIVLFGDISGFTDFCENVTNDEVEYDPFMADFDDLIDKTASETGYAFDDTGDGFMCTVDLPAFYPERAVVKVLIDLWKLLKKIERLIQKKDAPRPAGFRIVGAAGYVKRKIKDGGKTVLRGKHINHAHNLLDLARGKGFVCDDSLKQLVSDLSAKKNAMQFTPINDHTWILKIGRRA